MDLNKLLSELYGKQSMLDKLLTDDAVLNALKPRSIKPAVIDRKDDVTTVTWEDGSRTEVRRMPEDRDDPYAAFCAAHAKRVFGNNSKIRKMIDDADRAKVAERTRKEYERKFALIDKKAKRTVHRVLRHYKKRKNKMMNEIENFRREWSEMGV